MLYKKKLFHKKSKNILFISVVFHKAIWKTQWIPTQLAGAVEYPDCISTEG